MAADTDLDIVTISLRGSNDNGPLEFVSAAWKEHHLRVEEAARDVKRTKRAFDAACERLFEVMHKEGI